MQLSDIETLSETQSLECKLARGREGEGKLPEDFWPTYSAMANTDGGVVLLGIREKRGRFSVEGVPQQVEVHTLEDRAVIMIQIPAATRKQKPVYLNGNPLGNTYRRLYEGDRKLDEESVRRLLAEQTQDARDRRILKGFTLDDLDLESLRVYRRLLSAHKPDHPFLSHDDLGFLKQLGCYRQDRESGEAGLTLAAVLMFGHWQAIQEAVPYYFVDYQEHDRDPDQRWIDRIVPDGTWSGNIFDFYRKVYPRLSADLKVPFAIQNGQRQDDTLVHQALREALINTLVHADFSARSAVRVIKSPGGFTFINPGLMRVPLHLAYEGGQSDCRNQTLHQLFLMIGLGERAGSGLPKIIKGWQSQDWYQPVLSENLELEQTRLRLLRLSLVPPQILEYLQKRFGSTFQSLGKQQRTVMVMATLEEVITPQHLQTLLKMHPADASQCLRQLTEQGLLQKHGRARGAQYTLAGTEVLSPDDVFPLAPHDLSSAGLELSSAGLDSISVGLEPSSVGLEPSSVGLEPSSVGLDSSSVGLDSSSVGLDSSSVGLEPSSVGLHETMGRYVAELQAYVIHDLESLTEALHQALLAIAAPARQNKKLSRTAFETLILDLCRDQFITLKVIATLVARNEDYLRVNYLNPLAQSQRLERAFKMYPNDPRQAYRTASQERSE